MIKLEHLLPVTFQTENSCVDVLKNGGKSDGVYELVAQKRRFKVSQFFFLHFIPRKRPDQFLIETECEQLDN